MPNLPPAGRRKGQATTHDARVGNRGRGRLTPENSRARFGRLSRGKCPSSVKSTSASTATRSSTTSVSPTRSVPSAERTRRTPSPTTRRRPRRVPRGARRCSRRFPTRTRLSSVRRAPRSRRSPISTTTSWKKAKSRRKRTTRKRKSTDPGRRPAIAYLALGSNRGDRRGYLERALDALSRIAPVLGVSSVYRTEPVGYRRQRPFYNAVAAIRWRGSAPGLLRATQAIERELGRTKTFRNGPREIDIDILDVNGRRRGEKDPILPHPRLRGRRFVLAPLAEIAPDWKDPVTGETARELLHALPARPGARRLSSSSRGWSARRPGS